MSGDKICPLCGKHNGCMAGTNKESECWCITTTIPPELLELIPDDQRMKSCVCKSCVMEFTKDPKCFIKKS